MSSEKLKSTAQESSRGDGAGSRFPVGGRRRTHRCDVQALPPHPTARGPVQVFDMRGLRSLRELHRPARARSAATAVWCD